MSYMDLTNRVAIVTGGAQGIGLAISKRLANAGASVAIADINEAGAKEAAKGIVRDSGIAAAFGCDVSDLNSVQGMIERVLKKHGQIDILVNDAGVTLRSCPIQEQTDDLWHRTLAINLTGVFYCCRAVIPHMIKRRAGRIINIASVAGKDGNPNMVPYSVSKAGVIALTKSLGKEVAKYNIYINAITPGMIDTPMSSTATITPEQQAYFLKIIPLGRIGKPEEVAAMVHWLASDEVSFSTGAIFDITGGRATY
jgi:3-oxoacyl-[acyl-carrier protein] reductase